MKPAISIIFFTVSSGAGLGLIAFTLLFEPLTQNSVGSVNNINLISGVALVWIGLFSSFFHLANPRNAWRAMSRFKTSWLSREAVFVVLLFCSLAAFWLPIELYAYRAITAALVLLFAWSTLFSTAMIYASLKPIPLWHNPLTPINYLLLGHCSGALILINITLLNGLPANRYVLITMCLLIISASSKLLTYSIKDRAVSMGSAIGMTQTRVRLLDVGHSHKTFLTDEFGFEFARRSSFMLKIVMFLLAFLIPLLWLSFAELTAQGALLVSVSCFIGMLIERWLFFAEAKHVVRVYHGL